jgi:ubiquinone/menaquinone biosynthesis C-methylase UbiE/DNA-binding transcriptional ArsR family regulator
VKNETKELPGDTVDMDLQKASHHCRLLADTTRLRLLLLLEREELSVAELSAITQLAQPRVSTHLARLKEAELVVDRREGVFVYYRIASTIEDPSLKAMWAVLREGTQDPIIAQDLSRIPAVLNKRMGGSTWADAVAGDMERHYSPGRTWEATGRSLVQMVDPGHVLDIASGDGALAELLSPVSLSVTCLDLSERVVEAGRKRLATNGNVTFNIGDMHELPVESGFFDTVLLMHALTYTNQPGKVFAEVFRALKPGGKLLAVTLNEHSHEKAVQPFDHVNLGYAPEALTSICKKSGFEVISCLVSTVEKRTPNFAVLTLSARKP